MRTRALICLAPLLLSISFCKSATCLMRVVKGEGEIKSLLQNGGFENAVQGKPDGWSAAPKSFKLDSAAGRSDSAGLRCTTATASEWAGASQTLVLDRTNTTPICVRGWSKAQDVSGTPDSGYSLYVDIVYQDGTPLWGQTANFRCGTHDWQQREMLIFPEKPVRTLTLHCIFRGHSGTAWFDDVSVGELTEESGSSILDGMPVVAQKSSKSTKDGSQKRLSRSYSTKDGLSVALQNTTVTSIRSHRAELASRAPSGFLVRDVAENSDIYGFEAGLCAELSLKLDVECIAASDHLRLRGKVWDISGKDRAITLFFALPLATKGWQWGEDLRRTRLIAGNSECSRTVPVGCGATGTMSLYPFAAVRNTEDGIALGLDMAQAAQFRIGCNPRTEQFFLAYDFGLSPETERFPGAAEFSFVIFRFEPEWGFRAAVEKYMQIFPEHFEVRCRDQGIWMPFTDVSTVQGWEDFGFKFHEGVNNVSWDDAHGILSFRYTEPMTWWMAMSKEVPRTAAEAMKVRDRLAAVPDTSQARMAQISKIAAMWDDSGEPALSFRDTPWCNGAVWSINPNPHIPVPQNGSNGGTVYWNDSVKERLYGPGAKNHQDGEYLDSLEGYVTADLNFRREHFKHTTVPLTYASDTKQPALFKGLAVYEFTKWLGEDVHHLKKLMFANGVPYRLSFLCPWLDVLGTETDWLRDGKYSPASDEQMCFWRTMSGQKPYLLLMNTDYSAFTPDKVEKYFQRSLFYGMYPSMFSHNAADNPYWQNPKWYNRDRELFKKYIPLVRKLSQAGWQPITYATCDNPSLYLERFGSSPGGRCYISILNDTQETQAGKVSVNLARLGVNRSAAAQDLLVGTQFPAAAKLTLTLPPQQATVIEIIP